MSNRDSNLETELAMYLDENESILTAFEENVARMTQGLDESSDYELSFGVGANEETRRKLANLEGFLVQMYEKAEKLDESPEELFDELEEETRAQAINSLMGKTASQ